jgi:NADH dehydrogenase
MMESQGQVVTGAFGYSGRYIAQRLLAQGRRVRTLTNSPHRENPFQGKVEALPYNFHDPDRLTESLRGTEVLYNTYWVRFNYRTFTHQEAIDNTKVLFRAAQRAGVRRIVHVSITNPSEQSNLEYFRSKAILERELGHTGLPHTILRPAVLFGKEDILVNNMAWMLRHFPLFGVFGDGHYKIQPIFVDDLAGLAVEEGRAQGCRTLDAIGPETFTYRELVQTIGQIIGKPRWIISVPPSLSYLFAAVMGKIVGDTIVTREEIEGLMQNLLFTNSPPLGETRLTDWARANASTLGLRYASELARRRDRTGSYEKL